VIAARTIRPVVGVAMASGPLAGVDALLSTVQMPPGVPVGCVGIGRAGAVNAAVYAGAILAASDDDRADRMRQLKQEQADKTLAKDAHVRQERAR
jgi:phosphoribosylaminoimidazole carboxylase PurE protein